MLVNSYFKKFIVLFAISLLLVSVQPVASGILPRIGKIFASNQSTYNKGYLHLKFAQSAKVVLKDQTFVSSTHDLSAVNSLLSGVSTGKARLFSARPEDIEKKRELAKARSGKNAPDLNSYYRIRLSDKADSKAISAQLKTLPGVIEAYAEPIPAPAPAKPVAQPSTPSFVSQQTYLTDAANGVGATAGNAFPASSGSKVVIADLEYSWNTSHEDVSKARQSGARINSGIPADPFNDTNHGTAVSGVISGDANNYGVSGIVPGASLKLVNTYSSDKGWNIADAVYLASANLSAGDVILIEQQTWGPISGSLVPVEWTPAVYDAIKLATASNQIIIEAAGNSGVNLDDPAFGANFPMGKPDSGALIVGAGASCGTVPHRSRLGFSNYGSRVNLQGNGECVVTTGYGSLYSGSTSNSWYIGNFNGTSSASAIVASVAASISSAYEHYYGFAPANTLLKQLLIQAGRGQDSTVNSGNIGPLPNVAATQKLIDTIAPSAPANLSAAVTRKNQVQLSWTGSTDKSAVTGYRIYRNGSFYKTVTTTSFIDTLVTSKTTYSYQVIAVDAVGLLSVNSNTAVATTR